MSAKTVMWEVDCDAERCFNSILVTASPSIAALSDGEDVLEHADWCSSVDDAYAAYVREAGWQMGTEGVQRGHVYCPKHRQEWS